MSTTQEIISELSSIASCYSFGRILAYTEFSECMGEDNFHNRSQLANDQRLMRSERLFLAGLWVANVDLGKTGWSIDYDDKIINDLYALMNELHQCYKPTIEMPLETQLKEVAFYEGDGGYDEQYAKFATQKYITPEFSNILTENYHVNPQLFNSTYRKIKRFIEKQDTMRLAEKKRQHHYVSPMNLFTIKESQLVKNFSAEEINIIKAFSTELGKERFPSMFDIADRNELLFKPIIKLPNDRGYFFPDIPTVALAFNETPYYWITESNILLSDRVADLRGKSAEAITKSILNNYFPDGSILNNLIIRKAKTGNNITDIDLILNLEKENQVIVFQIKSKGLVELSKQGNKESIADDYQKAIQCAYLQGVISIDCLKEYKSYYTLKKLDFINEEITFHLVCITLDEYPTISSQSLVMKYDERRADIPLVAMTIYDLEAVLDMIPRDHFTDYLLFREKLSEQFALGINEFYYIGAYIENELEAKIYMQGYNIPREYAIFADWIYQRMVLKGIKINSFDDIVNFLRTHPLKTIQCQ